MKFIIPKNYNFKPKIFGLIDYKTATLDIIVGILLFFIVNIIFSSIKLKIYLFIGLYLPILLLSIIGIRNENLVSTLIYLIKYYKSQKIYLYKK